MRMTLGWATAALFLLGRSSGGVKLFAMVLQGRFSFNGLKYVPRPSSYPLLGPKYLLLGTIYPQLRVQGGSWLMAPDFGNTPQDFRPWLQSFT